MYAGVRILKAIRLGRGIVLSIALCLALGAGPALCAQEPAGRADGISGTVTIERAGAQQPLKPGDPIFLKDKIKTGSDSSAEIVFLDESRVKLAEITTLEITEYLYNPTEKSRSALVSMMSGKARFLVNDLQDFRDKRFRVQTATAVVGSRDTDFIVTYQPGDRDMDAAKKEVGKVPAGGCREGLVETLCLEHAIIAFSRNSPDRPVLLTTNMVTQICGMNLPTPPRFATPAERGRILRNLEQIGKIRTLPSGLPHGKGKEGQRSYLGDFESGMSFGGGEGGGVGEDLLSPGVSTTLSPVFGITSTTLPRRDIGSRGTTSPNIRTTSTTLPPVTTTNFSPITSSTGTITSGGITPKFQSRPSAPLLTPIPTTNLPGPPSTMPFPRGIRPPGK